MEVLVLRYRGEPLREFPLGSRPLEVGSGAGCDIVVHDARVRERHLLVSAIGGSVMLHELRPGGKRAPLRALELGFPVRIGLHHSIERVRSERVRLGPATSRTEPLGVELGSAAEISPLVGSGTEARRIPLDALPLTIGSGSRNDVVIHDRTVSGRHCRLEPMQHRRVVVGQDEALRLAPSNQAWDAETGTELKDRSCAGDSVRHEQLGRKHWQRAPCCVPRCVRLTLVTERQRSRSTACA